MWQVKPCAIFLFNNYKSSFILFIYKMNQLSNALDLI